MTRAVSERHESLVEAHDEGRELPEGWCSETIADFIGGEGLFSDGDWVETRDQDPKGDVRLIQLADIGDGTFKNKSNRFLTSTKATELGCTFLLPGDVLIARLPEPVGRACIFSGDPKKCVTAVDVCIVRPGSSGCDSHWIMHTVNAPQGRVQFQRFEKGTTRPRISRRNLASVFLPVPPLAEQKRIVAKVEQLLASVNAARERLALVPTILKRFHQAVLAAACSGRLTADWREANPNMEPVSKLVELVRQEQEQKRRKAKWLAPDPDLAVLEGVSALPESWSWIPASLLYLDARYGTSVKCEREMTGGIPVLRVPNIARGLVDLTDLKFTHLSKTEMSALALHEGDIVVCRTNGSLDLVGKAAAVPAFPQPYAFASYLIRLRLNQSVVLPQYFHYLISSPLGRDQIEEKARTTAGQFNLNLEILGRLAVALPPLEEQREIIRRTEALFRLAQTIEKRVAAGTTRADKLTQSILAKAFRGELVPTEAELARREGRDYEPASALLARVQAGPADDHSSRHGSRKPARARRSPRPSTQTQ